MKPKLYTLLTAFVLASPLVASGASLTWNSLSAGGTWDTTATNWLNGATPAAWNNATPDNAVFDATGVGTVTLGTAITTNSITVNTSGYTISGDTLTFTGTTPTINVTTGATATIASGVAGTLGYTKTGAGTVTFTGTKSITGPVIISAGTANISTGAAGSSLTVASGATANTLAGNAAGYGTSCRTWNINGTFNLATTGDSAWTTAAVLNNATMGSVAGSNWSFGGGSSITNTGTSTFSAGGNFVLREGNPTTLGGVSTFPITNNGTLIINCPVTTANNVLFSGSGTTYLNGANTSTGQAQVNSGTLALGVSSGATPFSTITIASGAVFDVSALASGFTVATGKILNAGRTGTAATDINGNLTVTGRLNAATAPGAGSLSINGNLSLTGGTVYVDRVDSTPDPINLTNPSSTLTLTGTNTISTSAGYFPAGTYTLINGFTSPVGDSSNLAWGSLTRGQTATFAVNPTNVQVTLDTGVPGALTWSGTTNGTWDVNTTANWNAGAEKFMELDAVTFPDGVTNSTLTLTGVIAPGSMAFTNASTAYVMRAGTGSLVGSGSLTKTGAGSLTMWNNANTFSGGTTISGGVLALNFGAAVPSGSYTPLGTGSITVNSGGTFRLDPGNLTGGTYTMPNAVTLNGGLLHQEDGVNHFTSLATIAAASTIYTQYGGKDVYFDGGLSGSANLVISNYNLPYGSGAVQLTASGSYSGTITLNNSAALNGLLIARSNDALTNATVVVNNTSGVDTYNAALPVGFVIASPATNVTVAALGGTAVTGTITTHPADGATMRTLTVNNATDSTFNGRIGGDIANSKNLNLVKNGVGTLTLNGANTYTGTTTINGGKLVIPSNQTGTGAITVNDGATLDLGVVAGNTLSPGSLTLGSSSGATLAIRSFGSSTTIAPITTGTFTTHGAPGSVLVNIGGTFVSGTFPVIKYTPGGSIGGSGFPALALGTLPRGITANLVDVPASGVVNLVVGATASLTWTGVNGTAWDINGTTNWSLSSSPNTYLDGDVVLFDNTGGANTSVVLNVTVAPASVTVNSTNSYTLSGSGVIGGTGGIVKSGSGSFTLSTANTFTGAVSIDGGTLLAGSPTALGTSAGNTVISGTGVLDLNGQAIGAEAVTLNGSGSGVTGTGAILNSSGTAGSLAGAITLTGDSTIGGTGAMTLSGSISGSSTLTKVGTGTLTLSAGDSIYPFTGTAVFAGGNTIMTRTGGYGRLFNTSVVVKNGATLTASTENAFQNFTSTLTVESGGTLTLGSGITSNLGGTFTMQGGSTLAGDGTNGYGSWGINNPGYVINVTGGTTSPAVISALRMSVAVSPLTLNVANVTGDGNPDLIYSGTLGGAPNNNNTFGVTLTGAGTVSFTGAQTYTGTTTISSGSSLILASTGQMKFTIPPTVPPVPPTNPPTVLTTVTGSGTAAFNGQFVIDTTAATPVSGNTWTLVNKGTLNVTFGGTFTVIGFTKSGTNWTKVSGSGVWTFSETTGVLGYTVDPYLGWISSFGITDPNDRLPLADPDHDGISNAIEFVLSGNPTMSDLDLLPKLDTSTDDFGAGPVDYLRFTFRRTTDSASMNPHAEYSSGLGSWTAASGTETATLPTDVVIMTNLGAWGQGIDEVVVFIPKSLALGDKLFVRLTATAP